MIPMTCDRERLAGIARMYAIECRLVEHMETCPLLRVKGLCACDYETRIELLARVLIRFGQLMYFEGSKDVYGLMTDCVRVTDEREAEPSVAHEPPGLPAAELAEWAATERTAVDGRVPSGPCEPIASRP